MKFNTGVHSIKWEFGYWGEVVDRWYAEGAAQTTLSAHFVRICTPTSELYTPAWNSVPPVGCPRASP